MAGEGNFLDTSEKSSTMLLSYIRDDSLSIPVPVFKDLVLQVDLQKARTPRYNLRHPFHGCHRPSIIVAKYRYLEAALRAWHRTLRCWVSDGSQRTALLLVREPRAQMHPSRLDQSADSLGVGH